MKRHRWSRPSAQPPSPPRKPRILVAGEFSAGKTYLINGLAGSEVLPSNVTATALPPVWMMRGDPALSRVDAQGQGHALNALAEVDLAQTRYCLLAHPAAILEGFDIIDTPGNSDPNMQAETWQRMLTYADAVVWCTNATQAWRQSEKAVWQAMPERLRKNALLLVTHADLLTDPHDAEKVRRRVEREASPYFDTIRMVSLLDHDHVDWVAGHLRELAKRLDEKSGTENKLAVEFAALNPLTESPQPADTNGTVLRLVRPRRVGRTEGALDGSDAPTSVIPLEVAQTAAAADNPSRGRARILWEMISRGVDTNDPAAILKAVATLLDTLEAKTTTTPDMSRGASGATRRPNSVLVSEDQS